MDIKNFYAAANDIDFIVNRNTLGRECDFICKPFIRQNNDKISKIYFLYMEIYNRELHVLNYIDNFLEHYTHKENLIKLLETQILKQIKNYIPFKINLAKDSYNYNYFLSYIMLL